MRLPDPVGGAPALTRARPMPNARAGQLHPRAALLQHLFQLAQRQQLGRPAPAHAVMGGRPTVRPTVPQGRPPFAAILQQLQAQVAPNQTPGHGPLMVGDEQYSEPDAQDYGSLPGYETGTPMDTILSAASPEDVMAQLRAALLARANGGAPRPQPSNVAALQARLSALNSANRGY